MFREEREGRTQKTKGVILGLIASFFVLGAVWFLLYSDFFKIGNIQINQLTVLSEGAVRGEIEAYFNQPKRWPWGNRNIFFLRPDSLEKYLESKFFVKQVTVDKIYPNILRLKIEERQRSVVLVTKNAIYIVDDYGAVSNLADDALVSSTIQTLSSSSPIEAPKEVLVITDTTSTYAAGQTYADSKVVRQWLDLANKLRDAGIWFKAVDLGDQPADTISVKVLLKENKDVVMSLDSTIDGQIETLREYLSTKPDLNQVQEYIDVRVPGKVFYK